MIAAVVMTVRFLCELAALAVLGWSGAHEAGVALAIALPVAAAALWGAWVAPRAKRRLRDPARFAVESIVWLSAIIGLVLLGQRAAAAGFGILAFATAIGARRFEPEVSNGDGSSRSHSA